MSKIHYNVRQKKNVFKRTAIQRNRVKNPLKRESIDKSSHGRRGIEHFCLATRGSFLFMKM